ncbi:MAG: radical SAM family heme chaperone HemW, partial [Bifidobacteriaceae bacterium]|nr:radical SAM family heme chaperone HemW [Bifidobacteriaceae bacterium]
MTKPVGAAFGIYIHVPFCARRCGYCDFNSYVAGPDERAAFVRHAVAELELAAAELERMGAGGRTASSVFFGGGTPTVLAVDQLVELSDAVGRVFGTVPGAEVTTEANPDSLDAAGLARLAAAGFNRVSFGMQSAEPAVLAALDRSHDPARLPGLVEAARAAGLDVSVDLIYGTPGESLVDWETSLGAALDLGVDHISAYALTLEPHTPMARRISRGELAAIDADEQADKYELADDLFEAAGLPWYEISNWARPGHESRHNLGYWTGGEWWGIGPGAHSAVGARRWWNLKPPRAYGRAVASGALPKAGQETLDAAAFDLERIMLRLRTAGGLAKAELPEAARTAIPALIADGLVRPAGVTAEGSPQLIRPVPPTPRGAGFGNLESGGNPTAPPTPRGAGADGAGTGPFGWDGDDGIVLTRRGRLLADLVTRRLMR